MRLQRAIRDSRAGMTLVEVLVAFVIFVLMVMALVALATSGLDTWTAGEERKDAYDRAQRVVDQVGDDLRNAFADDAWLKDPQGNEVQHAFFLCDQDANGVQRLRFVRSGGAREVYADGAPVRRPAWSLDYGDLWEVAYVLSAEDQKNTLFRGVRFFDRRERNSLLTGDAIARQNSGAFAQSFQALDTGVLWLGFRFWTPYTTTWGLPGEEIWVCANRAHASLMSAEAPGKCGSCGRDMEKTQAQRVKRTTRDVREPIGPSTLWDSSRAETRGTFAKFIHHGRNRSKDDPDFCYPEIVRVTVVVESQNSEVRGTRLTEGVSSSDVFLRLDTTRGVPDGPNCVKIDGEWIEYSERTIEGVKVRRRGARESEPESHATGARVRYGETFTTDVPIPSFREAVR